MMTLHERHPDVASQFAQEGFVVHKTKRPFSAIAIDHAHKQNNKIVKGDRRWCSRFITKSKSPIALDAGRA